MTEPIIQFNDLTKVYDKEYAVDHLSLSINKGEIFGLLGPNGAGKSTTILMTLGLSEPTSGTVTVNGINSTNHPIDVKKIVGYLPDDVGFYHQMTGLENLMYTASLNGMDRKEAKERALHLLELVGLTDAKDKRTDKYSRGMRQRLGLADVLMKNPQVIILDEPTIGIDPEGVRELLGLIKDLSKKEQITVLLSSHDLHQVQRICDRVGIFVKGKLLATGNINDLAQQLFNEDAYLINLEYISGDTNLIEQFKNTAGINEVEEIHPGKLKLHCEADLTKQVAKIVFESGAELIQISKSDYGLDEIYHRYFEGRDQSETA
ncbi:ABC transporter ATP-binding protein [Amphibacillus xylanus]|uniref:Putative ABC transporter ATP-binding protein n=1 Tax=Amphibacillus xylanus (strain ATCC 51415 / DSM 6626 / JCM 7361 / LMG 17667 / NBRC 15112 / Ep01) TaxID=698758 RepID=K0IWN8_AMPXN|nr:ABC transporter ATP-binding protein [Amphibacillus xylanus]BAM46774.1 putative ABC transporter ATP-binding protein [Amphibacillus xylanus NBRC 15112]